MRGIVHITDAGNGVVALYETALRRVRHYGSFSISGDASQDIEAIRNTIAMLIDPAAEELEIFCVSARGVVSADGLRFDKCWDAPGWEGVAVNEQLRERLGCVVTLASTTDAAVALEALLASDGQDEFLYVDWSTPLGVRWALLESGTTVTSGTDAPHMRWRSDNYTACWCKRNGCFATVLDGNKIGVFGSSHRQLTSTMAMFIRNLCMVRPVKRVVLGGGVPRERPGFLRGVQVELDSQLLHMVPVVSGPLAPDTGIHNLPQGMQMLGVTLNDYVGAQAILELRFYGLLR